MNSHSIPTVSSGYPIGSSQFVSNPAPVVLPRFSQPSHGAVPSSHPHLTSGLHGPTAQMQNAGQAGNTCNVHFHLPDSSGVPISTPLTLPQADGSRQTVHVREHLKSVGGNALMPFTAARQAGFLFLLQRVQHTTPSGIGQPDSQGRQQIVYDDIGLPNRTSALLEIDGTGLVLSATIATSADGQTVLTRTVTFSSVGERNAEAGPTLLFPDLQWLATQLPTVVLGHLVMQVLPAYDSANAAFRNTSGNPCLPFYTTLAGEQGRWQGTVHFDWRGGRFVATSLDLQRPGESTPQRYWNGLWTARSNAAASTTASTSLVRTRSLSTDSSGTPPAQRARLDDDGFMGQDSYRRLAGLKSDARVCGVIAVGAAVGATLPWDVAGLPNDGMTMEMAENLLLTHYGIQPEKIRKLDLQQAQDPGGIPTRLTQFFTSPSFNAGIIEYHWADNRTSPPSVDSHYITLEREYDRSGNPAGWRLSDSRTEHRTSVPADGENNIVAELLRLYQQGPDGQKRLSIRAFDRGHIRDMASHRNAAATFLQPTTTRTNGDAVRRLLGVSDPGVARQAAWNALRQAIMLPDGWNEQLLREATITVVRRDYFTAVDLQNWPHYHIRGTVPHNAAYARLTLPDGRSAVFPDTHVADLAQAVLDCDALSDELAKNAAMANYFIGIASQPMLTPGRIHDGAGFYRLERQAWRQAQKNGTDAMDTLHALHLGNVLGEPVAPALFAANTQPDVHAFDRMVVVAGALGRESSVTTVHSASELQTFAGTTTRGALIVEYVDAGNIAENRAGGAKSILLRKDGQERWWFNAPEGRWKMLPNGELAGFLQQVWHRPERDRSRSIHILEIRDAPQEQLEDDAIARRLRTAYSLMHDEVDVNRIPVEKPKEDESNDSFVKRVIAVMRDAGYTKTDPIYTSMYAFGRFAEQFGKSYASMLARGDLKEQMDIYVRAKYDRATKTWDTSSVDRTKELENLQRNLYDRLKFVREIFDSGSISAPREKSSAQKSAALPSQFSKDFRKALDDIGNHFGDRAQLWVRRLEIQVGKEMVKGNEDQDPIPPEDVDLRTTEVKVIDDAVKSLLDAYYPNRHSEVGANARRKALRVKTLLSYARDFRTNASVQVYVAGRGPRHGAYAKM